MTEREAFIRSICEQPEDDLRRLAFADWLDENGENRFAKYIRDSITDAYGGQYTAPLEMVRESRPFFDIPDGIESVQVRRGFIQWVFCYTASFTRHAQKMFQENPIIEIHLADKHSYYNGSGYAWYNPSRIRPSHNVPKEAEIPEPIFRMLSCGEGRRLVYHETQQKAMKALSIACVNYGRSLAGLPPLRISPNLPATST